MAVGNDGTRYAWFYCPGCFTPHMLRVSGQHGWTWNQSIEQPTFIPSIKVTSGDPKYCCHSMVTDGKIAYLDDCSHKLRGQTVELPNAKEALDSFFDGQ